MEFTEDQRDLRETVRRFLTSRSSEGAVRKLMDTEGGSDPVLWKELAALGLTGLAIPEEFGGAGCGWTEVGIVLEEAGRTLFCAPYFSTVVLATAALLSSKDETACAQILPGIADGTITATLALLDETSPAGPATLAAQRAGEHWELSGVKTFVVDGLTADVVLVSALTDGGVSLFAVDGEAEGLTRTPLQTIDLTRKQARLEFRKTRARLVGTEGGGEEIVQSTLDYSLAALSVELLGGAERCLEIAVDYAKTRYQFGRPIGSFQAIQHACADMLASVELSRSAAYHAVWSADNDLTELGVAGPLAKVYTADAFFEIATAMMQILGGIGFTWEHPAHLYLKRAKSGQHLLGSSVLHRTELAGRLGI